MTAAEVSLSYSADDSVCHGAGEDGANAHQVIRVERAAVVMVGGDVPGPLAFLALISGLADRLSRFPPNPIQRLVPVRQIERAPNS